MPRDHARINLAIWNDDDFRALPPQAQHLYWVLWTHPDLSYAGVVDWRPGRIAARAGGWARDDVQAAADCLRARLFLVTDDDTEEALLRSWVRWDGLMKQAHMGTAMATAAAGVASRTLRGVIVHEAAKLRALEPTFPSWAKPQVVELLSQPAIDPRTLPLPADPFTPQVTPAVTPPVTPPVTPHLTVIAGVTVDPPVHTPPTPSPSTTPSTTTAAKRGDGADTSTKKTRATRLPASWAPTDEHQQRARDTGLDVDREAIKFRAHADEKGRTAQSWNAAFTRWLMNAADYAERDGRPTGPRPAPAPGRARTNSPTVPVNDKPWTFDAEGLL